MWKLDSKSLKYQRWYYALKSKYDNQFMDWNWDYAPMDTHILMRVDRLKDRLHEKAWEPSPKWVNFTF